MTFARRPRRQETMHIAEKVNRAMFEKFVDFENVRWKPVIERAGLVGVKLDWQI
jgi:hypothetical protein